MVVRGFAAVLILPIVVAGCSSTGSQAPEPDLGRACQLLPCRCEDPETPFWKEPTTVPIEWKRSGEATCPAGYVLRKVKKEKK
jgi:hypothetical protein